MSYRYAVIGAGRQGIASAYDFIKYGDASEVILIDNNPRAADGAASLLNSLLGKEICKPVAADVLDKILMKKHLEGINSVISAVPYYFNLDLTHLAIEAGANFCDLGGNTQVVQNQLKLDQPAKEAGVAVVPDCGMDPGLNISMIMYLMEKFDSLNEIKSYGGGLPMYPKPPWNFSLTFHVNGLTNEYYGDALFLENGKVVKVPCFDRMEDLDFGGKIGKLEAAATSGGLSTLPFKLENKVQVLENKTLRYPGHWTQFKAYSQLGLFDLEPVKIGDTEIIPRDLYHTLLEPKITSDEIRDLGILRVIAKGKQSGKDIKADLQIIDYYDKETGFTAMQRLTGWHASIVAILAAQGRIEKGASPVDSAIPGGLIIDEIKKRGIEVEYKEYPLDEKL